MYSLFLYLNKQKILTEINKNHIQEGEKMSRLEINVPDKAQTVLEALYKDMERRIESSPFGLCPIDMSRAFLRMCHAQSCGKCTPCRTGLGQVANLMDDVLEGRATMETLTLIEDTATTILETADCAIGYQAAEMILKGLDGFKDEYISHIKNHKCTCSYKTPVPCVSLCPAGVDIPGYIALIREGRYEDAVRLIRKDNPFPSTCGLICEHPCEARCRRNIIDDAVNIRGLKRMACEYAPHVPAPVPAPSTGKKIAIVGGGPSGLSTAYYLQLMGHATTIYESNDKLGGMLRYGIPSYRLPKDKLQNDIDVILQTGVKVNYNITVGKDVTFEKLRKDYDALVIAIGASTDKKLGIEGEDSKGVVSAISFLKECGSGQGESLEGKEVCVIGGGNVSMDAVRTAVRKGAKKVSIVYRRRREDMTALREEINSAAEEGVIMQILKAPSKIETDDLGCVKGLWVTPQMIGPIKKGRASVRATGEPDYMIPCDVIIVAIGQDIVSEPFAKAGVPVSDRNTILSDCFGAFPNVPGVFAGGDCATGPATVIRAIAAAKVLAKNIDEYLGFDHEISCDVVVPSPNISDREPCGRVNMEERPSCERKCDFAGVEMPMSEAECQQEAERCLRCDHFGYGIFKGGRQVQW